MIRRKVHYDIVCDKCGMVIETNAASAAIANETVARFGWKTVIRESGLYHCCPVCQEKED